MTTSSIPASVAEARPLGLASSIRLPLVATALFLSSFLMFLVEPMIAKMLLPVVGGAPMVWNTCVVFFQMVLLAGYAYAYGASRWLGVARHRPVHVLLISVPLIVLPFATRPDWAPPVGNPIVWLLLVLTATIGLPFFALSTSASVLQHWFARTDHAAAHDPYFLYAASNLGSLVALAAYPTLVEPVLPLGVQSRWWATGYAVFVVLTCATSAATWWWGTDRTGSPAAEQPVRDAAGNASVSAASASAASRARLVLLSFVPSSLMLAVTSYLSTDVAAVPLLWIVPLSIYLLTFVIAFGTLGTRARTIARVSAPILVVTLAACIISQTHGPLFLVLPLHLVAFAALALQCHTELADHRPPASHLTEFYFWVSLGGMLGGLFNTLVAPVAFTGIAEYPLALALACVCGAGAAIRSVRRASVEAVVLFLGVGAVTALAMVSLERTGASRVMVFAAIGIVSIAVFAQRRRPVRFAAGVAGFLAAGILFANADERVLHAERTFFGVYRVIQDRGGQFHALAHGTTLHGVQALDPARRKEPLTYYHWTGPFGQAFTALPAGVAAREVAVIGLGAGALATYARPGQHWTFYEIDPAVERIARTNAYFSYLGDCGEPCRVVLGDARLSLLRPQAHAYDLIVLDAFSSDAIPIHLITSEALALYVSRLAPAGALIFHISNRHLQLGPVLARLAASQNLVAFEQVDLMKETPAPNGKTPSDWVVMARTPADLGPLEHDGRWSSLRARAETPLWTDDFSNILSVLRFK